MSQHVVRVPLQKTAPDDEDFILVHVQPHGDQPLDLTLTCTDNSSIFSSNLHHERIASMDGAQAAGAALWEAVLRWILLRQAPESAHLHIIEKLDLIAQVTDGQKVAITIRQNISGIIVRIDEIELSGDGD